MERIEDALNQQNVELLTVLHTKITALTSENSDLKARIEQMRQSHEDQNDQQTLPTEYLGVLEAQELKA